MTKPTLMYWPQAIVWFFVPRTWSHSSVARLSIGVNLGPRSQPMMLA